MRYTQDHKQATRQRILANAGRRFKQDGIDSSGVAVLMAESGLTNGAFYGHFDSKEDLVAQVVAAQLEQQRQRLDEAPPDLAGVEAIIRDYLSPTHRDDLPAGCPSAALLDEIARRSDDVKKAYTEGLLGVLGTIAVRISPADPGQARYLTLTVFALMLGTMQLSRALADPELADGVLEAGIDAALKLLGGDAGRGA